MINSDPTEATLTTADGLRLHVEQHAAVGPARGAVVFVHGFTMHAGMFRHLGAALAGAGLHVMAFDCRGHGRSEGQRGYVKNFGDYQADLRAVIARARTIWPDLPLAALGHSQGGLIVLATALSEPPLAVQALVLAAPWLGLAMKVPALKRALAPVLRVLWPTLALANGIRADAVTRDATMQGRLSSDPLIHHVATAGWFHQAQLAQAQVMAQAATLRIPTFILIPGDDRIASAAATTSFARAAGALVQTHSYPEAFHELFLEPEREQIIADIVSWLVPRLNARIL